MTRYGLADSERTIARCRIILSVAALIAVYIDPTLPTLTRWLPLTGGPFMLDPLALAVMLSHLGYSITLYLVERWRLVSVRRLAIVSTWMDVAFGAAILLVTEGANSPFYVFFTFAVLAAAFRAGLRLALMVTVISALVYLGLILVSHPWGLTFYIMRPAYLTITGYLVGYLGEQRLILESKLRALEAATQREHIARSLHDEYVQALAGVNLRLETCRQLLHRGQSDRALVELTELQAGVNREHDEIRTYIRSLVDREATPGRRPAAAGTRFRVRAQFDGSLRLVEHALQIMLEGARNVALHAEADSSAITVEGLGGEITITIDDDGVGFPSGAPAPWAIASRAAELGGSVQVGDHPGGHVTVLLPAA
jgi:signal transduction histidine kinase